MVKGATGPSKTRDPWERNKVFKHSAVAAFALLIATAPAIPRSLFDTRSANPATNRCDVYDPTCRPRQLFVRPPERSIKNNPLGNPARKLILPRDLNDRSGEPSPVLLFTGEPSRLTRSTLTCSEARRVIRYKGYRNIRTIKCGGKYHQFTARKRGAKYPVNLKVRATTGRIIVGGRIK